MDGYGLVLRLLHILGGVIWAGWAFSLALFVGPGVAAAGPEGGKAMQSIAGNTKLTQTMSVAPLLVVITGVLLFWRVSGELSSAWLSSAPGVTLSIGAVAGIVAYVLAARVIVPAAKQMAARGATAAGGPPPADLLALRDKMTRYGQYVAVLLAISVVTMAIASTV